MPPDYQSCHRHHHSRHHHHNWNDDGERSIMCNMCNITFSYLFYPRPQQKNDDGTFFLHFVMRSPQLSLSLDVINASSVPAVARGSSNCVWATEPTNCKSRSIRLWCVGSSPCWNQLGLPIKSRKLHDQPFSSSSGAWQGMFFCDMYF